MRRCLIMSRQSSLLAGALAAVVLMGCAAGVGAQTASEPMKLPPLPPAKQDASANDSQGAPPPADTQQQAATAPDNGSASGLPALPLDHDGVREVQNQLSALGFDPGPADGETGPATLAAVQQYNESRGGTGPVPVDGRLLARLQQDSGQRLTPEQLAARSRSRSQAQAPADPLAGIVQQFQSNLRALLNDGY